LIADPDPQWFLRINVFAQNTPWPQATIDNRLRKRSAATDH